MSKTTTPIPGEPVLPEARMHLVRPTEPVVARVVSNERCTASKAAGFVHHIALDVAGTPLEHAVLPGQAFGVVPPGEDDRGRPHKLRLYSSASPTGGEDGDGKILATTVKRTIEEHWETGKLFLGVASNYLCDLAPGDEVRLTGPNGKRFLLPADPAAHDYLFFATGTGIAPFRGMILDLLRSGTRSKVTLVMGAAYRTDLLYHDELTRLAADHANFRYLTAISREEVGGAPPAYVQDRLETHRAELGELLTGDRGLIYVCGVAGMELGIFRQLARTLHPRSLEGYLRVDPEAMEDPDAWTRRMIHKQVAPTRRVMLEVY